MRQTLVLCKFRPMFVGWTPKIRGNIKRSRNKRYVEVVTKLDKYKKLEELRQEEKVMKYLAAPYISEAQENAYLNAVGRPHQEYWDDFTRQEIAKPLPNSYGADLIATLNKSRKFEIED